MKHKLILYLFVLIMAPVMAGEQQVTLKEAESAANNWIKKYPEWSSPYTVSTMTNERGNIILYEIRYDSVTLLLSGSKACVPILGYYTKGVSVVEGYDHLPCNFKEFIGTLLEEINNCFDLEDIVLYHDKDWDDLINGVGGMKSAPIEVVSPLIRTQWNQSWSNTGGDSHAYNYLIPPTNNCEHPLVGCSAVALAQVMNYWQYPILYNEVQQFNWCDMTNTLDYNVNDLDYAKHRYAVSYLMFRCADDIVSVFGCDKTSSNLAKTRNALLTRYNYSGCVHYHKGYYERFIGSWKELIQSNLDEGKPVIYRGEGSGGHAFVCDGYNDDGEFHFNWGWAGSNDGYFLLDDLTPGSHNYNSRQAAIVNIMPSGAQSICSMDLNLESFYLLYPSLLNEHAPEEIVPQTMTTLTSASASSPQSWRTIPAGATAVYQAHEEVILQDGFEAEAGCEFEARIEPCALCDEAGNNMQGANLPDGMASVGDQPDTTGGAMAYAVGRPQEPISDALFPNPTDGPLTMSTDGMAQAVLVYTLSGNPVGGWRIVTLAETSLSLDVSALAPGTYLLSVTTPAGTRTAKFIRR